MMMASTDPADHTPTGSVADAPVSSAPVPSDPVPSAFPAEPVLAEIVRSGFIEGVHRGRLVLLAADGSIQLAVGDVHAPILPRSSNKPMQATGLLDAGLELTGAELALASASHAGEPFHVDGVRKILAGVGLDE